MSLFANTPGKVHFPLWSRLRSTVAGAVLQLISGGTELVDVRDNPFIAPDLIFAFDVVEGYFYWDGAERLITDATDNGDGTYDIDLSTALDMGAQAGFVEAEHPATPVSGHNVFSATTAANARFEVGTSGSDGSMNIYDSGTASFASSTFLDGGGQNDRFTFMRTAWNYEVGSPRIVVNGFSDTSVNSNSVSTSCDQIGIGYRRSFGGAQVFTGTVNRVYLYSTPRTEEQVREFTRIGRSTGFHWLGDSFLNSGKIRNEFNEAVDAGGVYHFSSSDQVGSSTLAEQATRFAATPRYHDQTLIIMDGGLTSDDTSVAALTSIVSNLGHDRWLYVQSNPVEGTGIGTRPDWDDEDAAIRAFCGEDHYLETLPAMQAAGDGGATDNADVALDIWPTSLRSDATHLNSSGDAVLADLIYQRVVAEGWITYTVHATTTAGNLAVSGGSNAIVSGGGTSSLSIHGKLADVNTELATLLLSGENVGTHVIQVSSYDPSTGLTARKNISVTTKYASGARVALMGNSLIHANNSAVSGGQACVTVHTGEMTWARAFFPHMTADNWYVATPTLGNRYHAGSNAGVSGAQVSSVQAFDLEEQVSLVNAYNPDVVIIAGGTNDLSASDTGLNVLSELETIMDGFIAAGKTVIMATVRPRLTSGSGWEAGNARWDEWATLNDGIRALVAEHASDSVFLWDTVPALIDETAEQYGEGLAEYFYDDVHLNVYGAQVSGATLADVLSDVIESDAVYWDTGATNIVPNPTIAGSSGLKTAGVTGTIPTGWQVQKNGGVVGNVGAACTVADGELEITFTSDGLGATNERFFILTNNYQLAVADDGSWWQAYIPVEFDASELWLEQVFALRTVPGNIYQYSNLNTDSLVPIRNAWQGWFITEPFQVPSGTTHFRPILSMGIDETVAGSCTMRLLSGAQISQVSDPTV